LPDRNHKSQDFEDISLAPENGIPGLSPLAGAMVILAESGKNVPPWEVFIDTQDLTPIDEGRIV
jgi:hypothetical protein